MSWKQAILLAQSYHGKQAFRFIPENLLYLTLSACWWVIKDKGIRQELQTGTLLLLEKALVVPRTNLIAGEACQIAVNPDCSGLVCPGLWCQE